MVPMPPPYEYVNKLRSKCARLSQATQGRSRQSKPPFTETGFGRNFDFCYGSEIGQNLPAEIKGIMIAQTRLESEYRNLLRCHNPFQLLMFESWGNKN
jgi:hypothetical protein